ncbi:hypothetical protein [Arthrobacter castelli]|uniref:hypothetical protein n=1 Tax=Arthrobacter castelli TaxID=271431 RepID=UPI000418DE03|nr:hypothetical protein [Arthrobacter castelli]
MTTMDIESFYVEGNKTGALIRRLSKDSIQTTLVFKIEDGSIIHLFQETWFSTGILDWTEYKYVDRLEGTNVEVRASTEPSLRDRTVKPIPSYAAHLVLKDFLTTTERQWEFSQFDEDVPLVPRPAAFVSHGTENVETPWGTREASKVVLEVDGREGNTFWCIAGAVVKSDWQGATSYATDDVGFVVKGLDTAVQSLLKTVLAEP